MMLPARTFDRLRAGKSHRRPFLVNPGLASRKPRVMLYSEEAKGSERYEREDGSCTCEQTTRMSA